MRRILIILLTLIVACLLVSPAVISGYTISTYSGSIVAKRLNHAQNILLPINTNKNILPAFSAASTLHVDRYDGESYSTIQDAIDNASDGDIVFVHNGIYRENIRIYKSIKLIGENRDLVIIDGGKQTDTILITSDNVTVENFTIKNSGNFDAGIKINSDSNCIRNCRIIECWDGIELNSANHNKIQECEIYNNLKEGIYLSYADNNSIIDCDLPNNLESIWLDSSNYNTIKNCIVESNAEEGVQIKASSHNRFISCKILSNTFGYGMFIEHESSDNLISKCKISYNGVGVFFSTSENRAPSNNTIVYSDIVNNSGTGIFFIGNGSLIKNTHIHFNNIYGNKKGMVSINSPGCIIYAQNNWWGSKLGPSIFRVGFGDTIMWSLTNGRIYFYPWLKKPVE